MIRVIIYLLIFLIKHRHCRRNAVPSFESELYLRYGISAEICRAQYRLRIGTPGRSPLKCSSFFRQLWILSL